METLSQSQLSPCLSSSETGLSIVQWSISAEATLTPLRAVNVAKRTGSRWWCRERVGVIEILHTDCLTKQR